MIGQGVLRECLLDAGVQLVITVGRTATGVQHPKLREIVQRDLWNYSSIETELSGLDACFFCLGVSAAGMQEAVFGMGCFWGAERLFWQLPGVYSTAVGYAGGHTVNPTYKQVCTGTTGHAEVVQVIFDPSQISVGQLLKVFFSVAHDPTELNRQGPDEGTQYRSVIFYSNENQHRIAQAYIAQLDQAKVFHHAIVTQVVPLAAFYAAEGYHQDYAVKNGTYISSLWMQRRLQACVDLPAV